MKKKSILLMLVVFVTASVLYNCKKKETDPLEPDTELVGELNNVTIPPVTLVTPTPVTTTPATVTASTAATSAVSSITSLTPGGPVPASLTESAAEVTGALSATEVGALASVNASTIAAVSAGGALSSELQAILTKVAANDKLKAYLPALTLPTVNGTTVNAKLKGTNATEGIGKTEEIAVSDECLAKADEAFNTAKTKLDTEKATKLAEVATAYSTAIAPLAANQTSCTSGLNAKYEALASTAVNSSNAAAASLEAARATLGEDLYNVLKALNTMQLLGYLSSLNTLKAAEVNACTAVTTAATAAAVAARDANTAAVEAAYQTALAQATTLRGQLLQSCHNQGGGN